MKNKILLSLFILTLITRVNAQITIPEKKIIEQPNVPLKIFKVTGVQVLLDSSARQGNGSTYFYFKAIINSTGGGIVSYQWVRNNPVNPSAHHLIPGTLTFNGTGTAVILITQGAAAGGPNSITLEVLSPNAITSNKLAY